MELFKQSIVSLLVLTLALISFSCTAEEQEDPDPIRRKSPIAIAKVKHAGTYLKIVYGQPYKNGRVIFGDLVPYGEVWRTGANEATELTTTGDILLADRELPAGTYTLFTIPGEENWTLIINEELGQWGVFDYDPSTDLFRAEVSSSTLDQLSEAFTIQFEEVQGGSADIVMRWDRTEVRIPVEFLSGEGPTTGNE